jgi:hypothetical protein
MQTFQLQPEEIVIALVYLERFSELSGRALTSDTWRKMVFIALMLASKVFEESPFDNEEIVQISPDFSLEQLCELERVFLQTLEFNLSVQESEYAKAQQLLLDVGSKAFALVRPKLPLWDAEKLALLHERCLKTSTQLRQQDSEGSEKSTDTSRQRYSEGFERSTDEGQDLATV